MNPRLPSRHGMALTLVAALVILGTACTTGRGGSPTSSATASPAPAASTPAETTDPPSTAATDPPSVDVTVVTIRSRSFGPAEITVAIGEVTFTNADSLPHTVTEGENGAASAGARFDDVIDSDATIVITFAEPGDYHITCQFHPSMHLLVHAH